MGSIMNFVNILDNEKDIVTGILAGALVAVLILLAVVLIIYIALGIFLTKFHKLIYGKGSACAWIPFANIYLLGKLAVNRLVGWILVVSILLTSQISVTINGETTTKTLIPYGGTIVFIAEVAILIYAIIKYSQIKKGEISKEVAAYKCNQFSFGGEIPANIQQQSPTQPTTESNSKVCPSCGASVPDGTSFCPKCGQQIQ